jgi:hypothetical protein
MQRSWRDIAAPIIAATIERVGRQDEKALRRALRDAYPFGMRKLHPYKIWCDEIRRQLIEGAPPFAPRAKVLEEAPGQLPLFQADASTRSATVG